MRTSHCSVVSHLCMQAVAHTRPLHVNGVVAALPFPGPEDKDFDPRILAAVVQETIFSQLLRLPESELGVLAYAKVTVGQRLLL